MKKADYAVLSVVCMVLGSVLAFLGLIYGPVKTSDGGYSFYYYSFNAYNVLLIFGGIVLFVIALGFAWRARQEQ